MIDFMKNVVSTCVKVDLFTGQDLLMDDVAQKNDQI